MKNRRVDTLLLHALNIWLCLRHPYQYIVFIRVVGYFPNIARPTRYHEKMLWRKIFDQNPLFKIFCDKIAAKDYIAERYPDIKIPKTLWVADHLTRGHLRLISPLMVIKANHGCDFNYFPQGSAGEAELIARLANEWLATDYGTEVIETAYQGINRKIFAEELIKSTNPYGLIDFSVRCCDGKAVLLSAIINNKSDAMKVAYFDTDGNRVSSGAGLPKSLGSIDSDFKLPEQYKEAVKQAETISQGIDYARYDFMLNERDIFVGEVTVYPSAGLSKATRSGFEGSDTIVNQHWDLRKSWFLNVPQTGWRRIYAMILNNTLV